MSQQVFGFRENSVEQSVHEPKYNILVGITAAKKASEASLEEVLHGVSRLQLGELSSVVRLSNLVDRANIGRESLGKDGILWERDYFYYGGQYIVAKGLADEIARALVYHGLSIEKEVGDEKTTMRWIRNGEEVAHREFKGYTECHALRDESLASLSIFTIDGTGLDCLGNLDVPMAEVEDELKSRWNHFNKSFQMRQSARDPVAEVCHAIAIGIEQTLGSRDYHRVQRNSLYSDWVRD